MRKEIVIAGFGGQGIILMGVIIAKMMEYFDDLQVAQAQSYGPVSRGGACRTDVILSDKEINYPKSTRPDLMIFMSEESVRRYLSEADPERTLIIYDSTLIERIDNSFQHIFPVPATKIAEENLGNRIVANIFMLGAAIDLISENSLEFLKCVVKESVPKKSEKVNMEALQKGYKYGRLHILGNMSRPQGK